MRITVLILGVLAGACGGEEEEPPMVVWECTCVRGGEVREVEVCEPHENSRRAAEEDALYRACEYDYRECACACDLTFRECG